MRRIAVAVGAVVLLAVGGVAYAAIPDSDGYTYICVNKTNGSMSAREKTAPCKNNETASRVVSTQAVSNTITYVRRGDAAIAQGASLGSGAQISCNQGDVATGGGYSTLDPDIAFGESSPYPVPANSSSTVTPTGWQVLAHRVPGSTLHEARFSIFVNCQHTA